MSNIYLIRLDKDKFRERIENFKKILRLKVREYIGGLGGADCYLYQT